MNVLFLITGYLLAIIWAFSTLPLVLRFHREAREVSFDVFKPRNAFAFFRIRTVPPPLRTLVREIRFRSIALIWTGAAFIALGLFLTRMKEEPNQPLQTNAGSRPSSGDSSVSVTPSSLGPRG